MNRTVQGRLVNELRAVGIKTMDEANRYLRERYLEMHNESFTRPPRESESAFVELGELDLNEIFFIEERRTVGKDNVVAVDAKALQIRPQPGRRTCVGLEVEVRRHLHGGYSIRRGTQLLGRYDAEAKSLVAPVEAAAPVGNRQRWRFPTRSLDAGTRPPASTASTGERVKPIATDNGRGEERFTASSADALRAKAVDGPSKQSRGSAAHSFPSLERPRRRIGPRLPRFQRAANL
jgi:hypothetical protein